MAQEFHESVDEDQRHEIAFRWAIEITFTTVAGAGDYGVNWTSDWEYYVFYVELSVDDLALLRRVRSELLRNPLVQRVAVYDDEIDDIKLHLPVGLRDSWVFAGELPRHRGAVD